MILIASRTHRLRQKAMPESGQQHTPRLIPLDQHLPGQSITVNTRLLAPLRRFRSFHPSLATHREEREHRGRLTSYTPLRRLVVQDSNILLWARDSSIRLWAQDNHYPSRSS